MEGNYTGIDDRISELPDEILSLILSRLTMRDAAKRRLLSSRWRHLSASPSNLHFDLSTIFGIYYDEDELKMHPHILWERESKFIEGVDQFLQLYKGPKIDSFSVWFCLRNEFACHIDRWLSFALKMETEKIDLNFELRSQCNELYNFPCHLLPCGKSSRLKHLYLDSCLLRPSPEFANRLNSLINLDLKNVPLDQSDIESIFSGCLKLEWLRLKNCSLPVTLRICSQLPRLKCLVVDDCSGVQNMVLNSLNLKTFEYMGRVKNFTFVGVPWLENVHLRFPSGSERGRNFMFNGLAKDLPQLQILSLVLCTAVPLHIPERMTRFSCLKQLELFVFPSTDFDLLSIMSFLNAAPVLQKFHVVIFSERSERSRGQRQKIEHTKNLHFQLKEVEIRGFNDRWDKIELAIYLLNIAVALEKMIVNRQRRLYHGGGRWAYHRIPFDELKPEHVYDLLLKRKVNPRAEIIVL